MGQENFVNQVKKIISDVQTFGDKSVVVYTRKFDRIENFSSKDIKFNIGKIELKDKNFIHALHTAIQNVKKFHIAEYKNLKKFWKISYNGLTVGQKFVPVDSVGIYIPGGRKGFNYISTVIMTVVPAKIAGVKKIVIVTPPNNVTQYLLYTLKSLGINEVYKIGGVQAIAALAFGTRTVPKVDMVIGPGNKWVTEAKRQLFGIIGIDLLAGPSEVVVVADKEVPIETVVYELLAQAEHDTEAKCWLLSLDKEYLLKVKQRIKLLEKKFLSQIQFVYVENLIELVNVINTIAPEHLTVLSDKYCNKILKYIKNTGAIFLGKFSSAVFGDYIAGPSHVLPTNKAASFSSGLSVLTFLKRISLTKLSYNSVKRLGLLTQKLAQTEGMEFHKKTVEVKQCVLLK